MKKIIFIFNSKDKYIYWHIPKFILIAKNARFTLKRLAKIIIRDGMTFQEKYLVTEILYNCEAILVQDFIEIGKVQKKVVFIQKI